MNNTEFFNAYVNNLQHELVEVTKVKVMMKTQIDMLEELVKKQAEKIKELEQLALETKVDTDSLDVDVKDKESF